MHKLKNDQIKVVKEEYYYNNKNKGNRENLSSVCLFVCLFDEGR